MGTVLIDKLSPDRNDTSSKAKKWPAKQVLARIRTLDSCDSFALIFRLPSIAHYAPYLWRATATPASSGAAPVELPSFFFAS